MLPVLFAFYVLLCLLVALANLRRRPGFVATLLISLFLTPFVAVLLLGATRGPSERTTRAATRPPQA